MSSEGRLERYRAQLRQLKAENEELAAHLQGLIDENNTLRESAPDVDSLTKERDDLKAQLAAHGHRRAFDEAAREAGIDPRRLDGMWKLAEYKAEGEADPRKIAEAVKATLKAHPYLKGEAAADDDQADDDPADSLGKPLKGARAAEGGKPTAESGKPKLAAERLTPGEGAGKGASAATKPARTIQEIVDEDFAATGRQDAFKI